MSRHTPGPWHIDPSSDDETIAVYAPETDQHVCTLQYNDTENERCVDTAQLIAAAPDLLAACKEAILCIASNTPMVDSSHALGRIADEMDRVRESLRAAIAKAEAPCS